MISFRAAYFTGECNTVRDAALHSALQARKKRYSLASWLAGSTESRDFARVRGGGIGNTATKRRSSLKCESLIGRAYEEIGERNPQRLGTKVGGVMG